MPDGFGEITLPDECDAEINVCGCEFRIYLERFSIARNSFIYPTYVVER